MSSSETNNVMHNNEFRALKKLFSKAKLPVFKAHLGISNADH